MTTQLELNSSLAPPLPLRRFSVAQYRQLGELGVLTPEDHVELLEGWIVEKMNQRPRRGYVVNINTPSVEQYRFSDPSTELQPTILAADAQIVIRFSEKELTLDLGLFLA